MQPVLELKALSKSFGGKRVVDRLTLAVPQGAICALLGDNGAGKTTTIRMLTGLLPPDAGWAKILGQDCWKNGKCGKDCCTDCPNDCCPGCGTGCCKDGCPCKKAKADHPAADNKPVILFVVLPQPAPVAGGPLVGDRDVCHPRQRVQQLRAGRLRLLQRFVEELGARPMRLALAAGVARGVTPATTAPRRASAR